MEASKLYTPELFQFVQDHLSEDPAQLLLRHKVSGALDVKEAAVQIAARQKSRRKLPQWIANPSVIFPPTVSLEQCSSEETAIFKRRFVDGERLLDLTGGFGVDSYYLGEGFAEVTYVERQEKLAGIARHNFSALGKHSSQYKVVCGDAIDFLTSVNGQVDWAYLDPARRGEGNQKLYKLSDCEPDIVENWELLTRKAQNIMVKASPMLDIKEALRELPALSEVHVVAVKNEVKELLLIWRSGEKGSRDITAWDLPAKASFAFSLEKEEVEKSSFSLPDNYLVLPSAAILKAGAFKSFGNHYQLKKLHPHTHLYTTSELAESTGILGRIFEIQEEVKMDKKTLRKLFPSGQVNVITRNYTMKPDIIKKKFRLKDGGEDYLVACTVQDGSPKAFWCKRFSR
ncbi:class I SAM-dependent methyltransferase [Echinicola strongylocentroti]|uniref:Class I SAM-dependent methyltransferase n=1 Tax=Echinicola strongylocentroti TaxID=1795355 RepID=A0A2Z4II45_9BACT|nr:class I SAM-dependent methyltransferase [Echinicola strongylocentroti]AWW30409.1 class I SAM-dependent methyltransferase [Echinicola strongylocentroti]